MNHHIECPCGCGELSDECAGPRPNPFGSITTYSNFRDTITFQEDDQ